MKKKLNLLCILVFVVLIGSIVLNFTTGFMVGLDSVDETSNVEKPLSPNVRLTSMSLYPENPTVPTDTVVNTLTGEKTPILYTQIVAFTKSDKDSGVVSPTILIFSLLTTIFAICAFVAFFRLVLRINKSNIFDWKNVRILRRLGIYLCILFVGKAVTLYSSLIEASNTIAIEGYGINWSEGQSSLALQLLLGLLCLISAEIFAIGLRMKEDQDLTI
jgi:hypothetical protein